MTITREQVIHDLADKTQYFQKDIRNLLYALDELVEEYLSEATDNEDAVVQLVRGIKVANHIVPERERRHPRTQEIIICGATSKPKVIFSQTLRKTLQKDYNDKNKGENT